MVDTLYNPFTGADEVVVRDETGAISVVRAGPAVPPLAVAPVRPVPTPLRPISPPPLPASTPPRPVAIEGDDIVAVSRSLAANAGVTLADPALVRRLANVVISRVKDIRSQIEVLEILRRPVKVGGLGVESGAAEKLGRIIELQLPKLVGRGFAVPMPPPPMAARPPRPPGQPSLAVTAGAALPPVPRPAPPPSLAPTPPRPVAPAQPPAPVRSAAATAVPLPPVVPPSPAPARGSPPPAVPRPSLPVVAPRAAVTPAPTVAAPVVPAPVARAVPPAAASAPVPAVPPPREVARSRGAPAGPALVGTEEELGRFTLVDFRRLDPNPAVATAKIRALFGALERESFARRAAGLAAWRGSELYALYTAMGSESMTAKQPIAAVAQQRTARGQPTLTVAEFEAIMDLNQQLRF